MPAPEAPPSPDYPRYFQTIVGMAPDKIKYFTIADMQTLVEVFTVATGIDPLKTDQQLADVWRETVKDAIR